jgi:hypothetical protein
MDLVRILLTKSLVLDMLERYLTHKSAKNKPKNNSKMQ